MITNGALRCGYSEVIQNKILRGKSYVIVFPGAAGDPLEMPANIETRLGSLPKSGVPARLPLFPSGSRKGGGMAKVESITTARRRVCQMTGFAPSELEDWLARIVALERRDRLAAEFPRRRFTAARRALERALKYLGKDPTNYLAVDFARSRCSEALDFLRPPAFNFKQSPAEIALLVPEIRRRGRARRAAILFPRDFDSADGYFPERGPADPAGQPESRAYSEGR